MKTNDELFQEITDIFVAYAGASNERKLSVRENSLGLKSKQKKMRIFTYEKELSHRLEQKIKMSVCIVSVQTKDKKKMYQILTKKDDFFYGARFIENDMHSFAYGKGVARLFSKLLKEVTFVPHLGGPLIEGFKSVLKEEVRYRLFEATGQLKFYQMRI
mgnify:CR=1 FL=1